MAKIILIIIFYPLILLCIAVVLYGVFQTGFNMFSISWNNVFSGKEYFEIEAKKGAIKGLKKFFGGTLLLVIAASLYNFIISYFQL